MEVFMRRALILLVSSLFAAVPLAAQNTDIESLSGLQFNVGNPGARSLGMGGAFLGLADDASAAEANPAGLTILRKPEFSIETRNYAESQIFTTSGTYPDFDRTGFRHYSQRAEVTFGSFVYPKGNFAFAGYYHEPLRNEGSGQVIPQTNQFTGRVEKDVPNFYIQTGGSVLSASECDALRKQTGNFFSCVQYAVIPFLSALDVRERTWGLAGAYKIGPVSIGVNARFQTFDENALTFRVSDTLDTTTIVAQATGDVDSNGEIKNKQQHDLTYGAGVKWTVSDRISIGAVYKKGPKFATPTFAATADTNFGYVKIAETEFQLPDTLGLGFSVRPIPVLTINVDAVRVSYSQLVGSNFYSVNEKVRELGSPYHVNDATELHVGGEYFFSTKIPFAVRAGYWRDPEHSLTYTGPLDTPDRIAAAILYPGGKSQNHKSVGVGLAWPRFQVDAAYDTAENYKVGSISFVARY
jgi:long-subunit fatty acid transport protein